MALSKLAPRDRHQLAVDTEDGRGWWCMVGRDNGELVTYEGRLIVHSSRAELCYLVPGAVVRPVPESARSGPFCPLSAHPGFTDVRTWDPIDPKEFRA